MQISAPDQKMENIRFERHFRTPYSEGFHILQNNERVGAVELHFTTTVVHGTIILHREYPEDKVAKLIESIDEELVLSADMPRDDFLVSVYVGKEVGFYSDDYFTEEEMNEKLREEEDESEEVF